MKTKYWILALIALGLWQTACHATKKSTVSTQPQPTPTPVEKPVETPVNNNPITPSNTPVVDENIGEIETATLVKFIKTDQLDAIMAKAKREKKVVFIDFFTTWCAPCRIMDQSTFRDEDIAEYMNENCVSMKLNAEQGEGVALRIQYGVDAYPTYIFIDAEGNEVSKKVGSLGIEAFKKFMKEGVLKVKKS